MCVVYAIILHAVGKPRTACAEAEGHLLKAIINRSRRVLLVGQEPPLGSWLSEG